jgi:formate-dependent nitrite reductase membrane component NrfD
MLYGAEAAVFWLGLVLAGLALPLILENCRLLWQSTSILASSVSVLVGGFVLRWILVQVGLPALPW